MDIKHHIEIVEQLVLDHYSRVQRRDATINQLQETIAKLETRVTYYQDKLTPELPPIKKTSLPPIDDIAPSWLPNILSTQPAPAEPADPDHIVFAEKLKQKVERNLKLANVDKIAADPTGAINQQSLIDYFDNAIKVNKADFDNAIKVNKAERHFMDKMDSSPNWWKDGDACPQCDCDPDESEG